MKKTTLFLFALLFSTIGFSQVERPSKAVGDDKIDKFVTAAFDLSDKKNGFPAQLNTINEELTVANNSATAVEAFVFAGLDKRLTAIEEGYKSLSADLETLSGQGEDMVTSASSVSPATKILKATKNVKAAVSVLADTKKGVDKDVETAATVRARLESIKKLNETK